VFWIRIFTLFTRKNGGLYTCMQLYIWSHLHVHELQILSSLDVCNLFNYYLRKEVPLSRRKTGTLPSRVSNTIILLCTCNWRYLKYWHFLRFIITSSWRGRVRAREWACFKMQKIISHCQFISDLFCFKRI
jgi:hypothetical protein